MAKTITLQFEGKCADRNCGAILAVGAKAKWYGKGKVYGIGCHDKPQDLPQAKNKVNYYYSPSTGNEWSQRSGGRCEDAPCCGCCTN